jgi:hypothetical protein
MLEPVEKSLRLWDKRIQRFENFKRMRLAKKGPNSKNTIETSTKVEKFKKIRNDLEIKFGNMTQQEFNELRIDAVKRFNAAIKTVPKSKDIDQNYFEFMAIEAELQIFFGDIPRA